MITLYVTKFEVTQAEGPVVSLRLYESPEDVQEFKIKVPTYDMNAWAQAVGCHVPLDPGVMANMSCVWLTDKQESSES